MTVEEGELLLAVGDEVCGVEVQNDPRRLVALLGPATELFDPELKQKVTEANELAA